MTDRHREAAIAYVDTLRRETGLDLTNLARHAGVSSTTLTRFHNNPDYRNSLSGRTLKKLSDVTGIPLPPDLGGIASAGRPKLTSDLAAISRQSGSQSAPRDLPIVGRARSPRDAYFFDGTQAQAYVERPWFLFGQPDAYAVHINDDTMEPTFRHGHLVYVSPAVPASSGDDVVVLFTDGRGVIKRLRRRTAKHLVLEQFSPAKRLDIEIDRIRSVHLIVAVLKTRI
jgi:phage repressor protein C with HTH and peptisase S24 domain